MTYWILHLIDNYDDSYYYVFSSEELAKEVIYKYVVAHWEEEWGSMDDFSRDDLVDNYFSNSMSETWNIESRKLDEVEWRELCISESVATMSVPPSSNNNRIRIDDLLELSEEEMKKMVK